MGWFLLSQDQSGCDVVRESGLAHDDSKKRAVDALQMPDLIRFDLIANQANRPPRAPRFGGNETVTRNRTHDRLLTTQCS
jgi:hypothetical protein